MNLAHFSFLKDTPFIDFQNTIYFEDNVARDDYMDGFTYKESTVNNFNFIRDRSTIVVDIDYYDLIGYNYGYFYETKKSGRIYFYIGKIEYVNDKATRITFVIDGIMTYCQGGVLNTLGQTSNINVLRQSLPFTQYRRLLPILKTNDDVLKCDRKEIFKTKTQYFNVFYVLFQSSADLSEDFGKEDDPKLKTSSGQVYDRITSPLNLYVIESPTLFNDFMRQMKDYPWIAQNIKNITMIPTYFIDTSDLEKVTVKSFNNDNIKKFKNDERSKKELELTSVTMSYTELLNAFKLKKDQNEHLLRSEYAIANLFSWDGQKIDIDLGYITDLKVVCQMVIGYNNEIKIYVKDYKSKDIGSSSGGIDRGTYINESIVFNSFDEIPILIDNYKLSLSNNAHQRQLSEDRLITGRVQKIFGADSTNQDRFFNAVSVLSNLNPRDLMGKFTDEYEFYRDQQAQFADMAITSPTITNSSNGNSFMVATDSYGVSLKLASVSDPDFEKIDVYYKKFGFDTNNLNTNIYSLDSMSIVNYLRFEGSWIIKDVDVNILEIMRAQFANGVLFWHTTDHNNPFSKDIKNNERIK